MTTPIQPLNTSSDSSAANAFWKAEKELSTDTCPLTEADRTDTCPLTEADRNEAAHAASQTYARMTPPRSSWYHVSDELASAFEETVETITNINVPNSSVEVYYPPNQTSRDGIVYSDEGPSSAQNRTIRGVFNFAFDGNKIRVFGSENSFTIDKQGNYETKTSVLSLRNPSALPQVRTIASGRLDPKVYEDLKIALLQISASQYVKSF